MAIPILRTDPNIFLLKSKANCVELRNGGTSTVTESKDQSKLKKACQDFEAIFLNYMLSKMRESVPKSDLMGSSRGEEIYRSMLDEELAKQMAESGGVGLGNILYQQFTENRKIVKVSGDVNQVSRIPTKE